MTDTQEAVLALLDEIDGICSKLCIRYFLVGQQLLFATRKKGISGYDADIAMSLRDFTVFSEYIKTNCKDDRCIESYQTNDNMPGLYYRYVNTETLLLDLDYSVAYQAHGVAINILILRRRGKAQKVLSLLEKGMSGKVERVKGNRLAVLFFCMGRTFLGQRRWKSLFQKLEQRAKVNDFWKHRTVLCTKEQEVLIFPKKFWVAQSRVLFHGRLYEAPKDCVAYCRIQYGENWQTKTPPVRKETYMCARNAYLSYREYLKNGGLNGIDFVFFKRRQKYLKNASRMTPYNRAEKRSWNTMYTLKDAIRFRDADEGEEKAIMMWNAGYHDMAIMMMGDYRRAIERAKRNGIDLSVNRRLWDIYQLWERENGFIDDNDDED